jgi:hypothetical protein
MPIRHTSTFLPDCPLLFVTDYCRLDVGLGFRVIFAGENLRLCIIINGCLGWYWKKKDHSVAAGRKGHFLVSYETG